MRDIERFGRIGQSPQNGKGGNGRVVQRQIGVGRASGPVSFMSIFDQATGNAFLSNILEQGGSRDAMELFKAFRGREPKIDALLRHNGIAA